VNELLAHFLEWAIALASEPCWHCGGTGQVSLQVCEFRDAATLSNGPVQHRDCAECDGTGTRVPEAHEDGVVCGVFSFLTGAIAQAKHLERYDLLDQLIDLQISYAMALAKNAADSLTADKIALLHERLDLAGHEAPSAEGGALSPDEIAELLGDTKEDPHG
jgi:hypothetical protein